MTKISILVVDDHPAFRQGLAALLNEEPDMEVIATLEDGRQAVEMARKLKPEVVILDISMPNLNGIESARQIKEASPDTSVLMLSAFN